MPRTNLLVSLGLVAAVAYLAISMRDGFIAHDEGLLAQSAERTLAGEAPHVDFDDPYTGGLSHLHAAAFRALGARSSSLRVVLLLFSAAFVIAYYHAARRLLPTFAAVLATFAAVAWGPKNYFAGMPSWYNLFFATFGTLALMIDAERPPRRRPGLPLFLAGLAGGLSLLVKISGLYFVLAGLLYVLYDAHVSTEGADSKAPATRRRFADACAWLAPFAAAGCLLVLLKQRLEPMDGLHFLLPGVAVATLPWILMRRRATDQMPPPDAWLLRRACLFLGGVAVPPLLFVAVTVAGHGTAALTALYRGIFVLPRLRLGSAADSLPPIASLVLAAPLLLLCLPWLQRRLSGWVGVGALAAGLGSVLALAGPRPFVYQTVWAALRPLTPLFVALAVVLLVRQGRSCDHDRRLYLLASVVAFASLIQYPYAFGTYFFYAAPLIFLLIADVWTRWPSARRVQACVAGFLVLFAVLWLNGANPRKFGVAYEPSGELALLAPERINLRVPVIQQRGYQAIAGVVERQTSAPDDVWAGPDAPEIYFLTAKRNPDRGFYQFFDPDWEAGLLARTAEPGIRLLVINRRPEFSKPMSRPVYSILAERFPESLQIGPMEIRWR